MRHGKAAGHLVDVVDHALGAIRYQQIVSIRRMIMDFCLLFSSQGNQFELVVQSNAGGVIDLRSPNTGDGL